jgi:transposase, IS30 family
MTKTYQRLTYKNRVAIYYFIQQGLSQREIARQLNVSPSTVSREIARNQAGKRYFPEIAQHKTRDRWYRQTPKLQQNSALRRAVIQRLRKQWSPEQISADLKTAYTDTAMHISTETIYSYLYVLPRGELRKTLIRHLRQGHTRRRKRGNGNQSHAPIPDIISIHERPPEVEDRTIPGHWEGDLIVGERHQTALGTLVERTTRTTLLIRVRKRDAETVRKAFARRIKCLPKQVRLSMTYDRGGEMAQHKLFTKETKMKVYFADPYSPWQRGTNENTNGLIRQYFPKGTDFATISDYQIRKVQNLLNTRPRKALGWKTPIEAMNELLR